MTDEIAPPSMQALQGSDDPMTRIMKLEGEITRLLDQNRKEKDSFRGVMATAIKEANEAKSQLKEFEVTKRKFEQLKTDYTKFQKHVENKYIYKNDSQVRSKQCTIETQTELLDENESDNQKIQTQTVELVETSVQTETITAAEQEKEETVPKADYDKLKNEFDEMEKKTHHALNDRDHALKKLKEIEDKNHSLTSEIDKLKDQLEYQKILFKSADTKNYELEQKVEDLQSQAKDSISKKDHLHEIEAKNEVILKSSKVIQEVYENLKNHFKSNKSKSKTDTKKTKAKSALDNDNAKKQKTMAC